MTDTSPESATTPRPASLQRIQAVPRRPPGVPPRRPRVVHAHGGARLGRRVEARLLRAQLETQATDAQ